MEFKEELELLLNNFIITKANNRDAYYKIRSKIKKIKEFALTKLGCDIIVNSYLIKLEKIPSQIDQTFRIEAFDNKKDYIFFILIIMFLEEKTKDEQFILSSLIQFITNSLATFPDKEIIIDFKDFSTRKSLVDVLKYATKLGILSLVDGNDMLFKDSSDVELLYQNTGISHYIVRQFREEIFSFQKPEDFLYTMNTEDLLNKKRYFTYRSLLFYPVFHYKEFEPEIYNYFINYRNRILHDLDNILDGDILIFKNMALLTTTERVGRLNFPNSRKVLSDIILLVNDTLVKKKNTFNKNGFFVFDEFEFHQILKEIKQENKLYFSKEYREMPDNKFYQVVTEAMKDFKLLTVEKNSYEFSPVVYLLNGNYPKEEVVEDIYQQLSLDEELVI